MFGLTKKPQVESTTFSTFIRTASAAEKKRVYKKVLSKAIERQNDVMRRAEVEHRCS